MQSRLLAAALGLCLLSAAFACSDDPASAPSDPASSAGSSGAAGATGTAGVGGAAAGGMAGGSGADQGGEGGAAGAPLVPAEMNLSIVKNDVAYPLERAQFGLTKITEGHEIYVEAHFGGDPACPTESSPSPDRTLIITGLLAEDPSGTVVTEATHARANLLDFEGAITTEPILKGTTVTLTSLESNACPDCAAGDPSRFVGFVIDATLSDGTKVTGTVRATHCGSLDQ